MSIGEHIGLDRNNVAQDALDRKTSGVNGGTDSLNDRALASMPFGKTGLIMRPC